MKSPSKAAVLRAVSELTVLLQAAGQESKKAWWERYLKHTIPFYGTPMADIRKSVHAWHDDDKDNDSIDKDNDGATSVGKSKNKIKNKITNKNKINNKKELLLLPTAWELFRQPIAEQKLCGILMLQELALPSNVLDATRDLPELEQLFDEHYICDWNTTDWLCVRVLGPWIQRDYHHPGDSSSSNNNNDATTTTASAAAAAAVAAAAAAAVPTNHHQPTAQHIASWVTAPTLWRQRASLVSFVNINDEHSLDLQFQTAAILAQNPERFAQTAIGWVLRERSKTYPERVVEFLQHEPHAKLLTSEARNMASAKLTDAQRATLGLSHKRKRR